MSMLELQKYKLVSDLKNVWVTHCVFRLQWCSLYSHFANTSHTCFMQSGHCRSQSWWWWSCLHPVYCTTQYMSSWDKMISFTYLIYTWCVRVVSHGCDFCLTMQLFSSSWCWLNFFCCFRWNQWVWQWTRASAKKWVSVWVTGGEPAPRAYCSSQGTCWHPWCWVHKLQQKTYSALALHGKLLGQLAVCVIGIIFLWCWPSVGI